MVKRSPPNKDCEQSKMHGRIKTEIATNYLKIKKDT